MIHKISSNIGEGCPERGKHLEGHDDFAGAVNHVIGHGWTVEHVGQETVNSDTDGKPYQFTVAVLARR